MKLTAKKSRKEGLCYVVHCKRATAHKVDGKSFFSKRAGILELCTEHTKEADELALKQGTELVYAQPEATPPDEGSSDSTAIVVPSGAIRDEMEAEAGEAKEALTEFQAFDILTKDDLTFAAEMLAETKGHFKRLDAKRKLITKPLNDALKATNALFKPALNFYSECERALKAKMGEAHRRAQDEQRAALAEAQEAATDGDESGVHEALSTMDEAASFPEVDGVQYRSSWKFEITDEDAVPREYCEPNLKLIAGVVSHRKGATEIAGVRAFEDTVIASKSA